MSNSNTSGKGGAGGAPAGNVYDQSAQWFGNAGNLMGNAAAMYSSLDPGKASTYDPRMIGQAAGYRPDQIGQAATYKADQIGRAARMDDPMAIKSGMQSYMNPYERNVINRSMADMSRMINQQDADIGAGAANSGAFGGARHGLLEATVRSEGQKNLGDLAANLRHQGFNTAAQLSGQDIANSMMADQYNTGLQQQTKLANQGAVNAARSINTANQQQMKTLNQGAVNTARQFNAGNQQQTRMMNQGAANAARQYNTTAQNQRDIERMNAELMGAGGLAALSPMASGLGNQLFGIGQQITQDQMGAGALQQQLMQQILDRAGGQYDQKMGMPQNLLNMALASLGMNPMTQATTTTGQYKPGLLDYLSLGTQGLGAWWQR